MNSIQTASATTTDYVWYDGAVQGTITFRESVNSSGASMGGTVARTSVHAYDASGTLLSANITDGRSRTVTYNSTAAGQVVRREEDFVAAGKATNYQFWYRFGGKELAYAGNGSAGHQTSLLDYDSSIALRTKVEPNEYNAFSYAGPPVSWGGTEQSLRPVNSFSQGSASGGYQARAGETLASIAANLWGDSSLWYKLAEANGLSGQAALSEGQSLRIPAGVIKNTHNASTFQPYDPAETIGDTSPTTPKPPKTNKCGAMGQIMLVVVAVVVSIYTAGAAAGAMGLGGLSGASAGVSAAFSAGGLAGAGVTGWAGFAAGAIGGAVGSVASQAVGVATGIQDKFSWNAVAMAAIGGGVGGGIGLKSYSGWGQAGANAAAQNLVTQGIGMALGLQKKFSRAGVAAAGIGGSVGYGVGGKLGDAFGGLGKTAGTIARHVTAGTASALADAATRTALGDGNFGDNLRAAIPNVIGQALGNAIGDRLSQQAPDQLSGASERAAGYLSAALADGSTQVDASGADISVALSRPNHAGIDLTASLKREVAALTSRSGPTQPDSSATRLDTIRVNLAESVARKASRGAGIAQSLTVDPNQGLSWQQIIYRDNPQVATIRGRVAYVPAARLYNQTQSANFFENNDPWSINPVSLFKKVVGEVVERQAPQFDLDHEANMLLGFDTGTGEFVHTMYPDGSLAAKQMWRGDRDFSMIEPVSSAQAELGLGLSELVGAFTGAAAAKLSFGTGATRSARPNLSGSIAADSGARKVTVFRVEGATNSRFVIDEAGNVSLTPGNKTIWLNFGQEGRATSYLNRKVEAGLPDAQLKSFEIDSRFLQEVRATAVPENVARRSPGSPIISRDPYPDQFGIRQEQYQRLLDSIHQGTGRNVRPSGN